MIEQLSPEARTFLSDFLNQIDYEKDKEIKKLKKEKLDLFNKGVELNLNIREEKDKEIERLNNILKEIRKQLDYLETYSSKEDVFEDMKRRLDRIDKIIGSDK